MNEKKKFEESTPPLVDLTEEERRAFSAEYTKIEERRKLLSEYSAKVGTIVGKIPYDFYGLQDDQKQELLSRLRQERDLIKRAFTEEGFSSLVLSDIEKLCDVRNIDSANQNAARPENNFVRLGLELIADLRDDIGLAMRNHGLQDWKGFSTLNRLVEQGTLEDQTAGVTALFDNRDLLEAGLKTERIISYEGHLATILKQGTEEQALVVADILKKAVREVDPRHKPWLISTFFVTDTKIPFRLQHIGWGLVFDEIEKSRLPYSELVEAWLLSTPPDTLDRAIYKNLEVIAKLEFQKPGAALFLYSEFGIIDFGRYPAEMLLEQAEKVVKTWLEGGSKKVRDLLSRQKAAG